TELEVVLVVGAVIRLVLGMVEAEVRVMELDLSQWSSVSERLGLGGEGPREWDIKEFLSKEVLRIKGHRIER
ncbi:hypothetical protein ACLOJK_034872, partial [Asimina triloba]